MAAVGAVHWAPAIRPRQEPTHSRPAGSLAEAQAAGPPYAVQLDSRHNNSGLGQAAVGVGSVRRSLGRVHRAPGSSTFWGESALGQVAVCEWPAAGVGQGCGDEGLPRRSQQPITCLASKRATKAGSDGKTANGTAGGKGAGAGGAGRPAGSRGFGSKPVTTKKPETKQDGAARLKVSERAYLKMLNDETARSYVISVRRKGEASADWLPVASIMLLSKEEAQQAVNVALPFVCREVAECARRYAIAFENCLSHELEYAYQPEKIFMEKPRVVAYLDGKAAADARKTEDKTKEEECPYTVLGLSKGSTSAQIRTAYRAMAAAHHPDRHAEEEREQAEERFKRVAEAYERIKRDTGGGELVGGTGTLAEEELTVVPVEGYEEGPLPTGMKVAVYLMDFGITDLFVKDKKFKRAVDKSSQQYWSPVAY